MFKAVAKFEIRYLLRNPLVWVTAGLTFAALAASTSLPDFELGSEGGYQRNAARAIVRNLMMLSVLYMTVLTAFVANAATRDDDTGFGPIIRATPLSRFDYLLGRFFGALAVVAGCMMLGAVGMWAGTLMPFATEVELGPNRLGPYVFAYFAIALPNLFVGGAVLYAIAAFTRSMLATYLGVIAFGSVFFFVGGALEEIPTFQGAVTLVDPFGIRAVADAERYWTVAQGNLMTPDFAGMLLVNRAVWVAVAVACLALVCVKYRWADRAQTAKEKKQQRIVAADAEQGVTATSVSLVLPAATHGGRASRALLWLRTRFETSQILTSPVFAVLMAWELFVTLISLTTQRDPEGRPSYPTTLSMIPELEYGLEVVPILIAVFFAGELVWRERDRRMNEIVDASPMPNWAYVLPKTIAMALVLTGSTLVAVLASVIVQLSLGYTELELGKYVLWFVVPKVWDMMLIAAVTVFVHALSPHKVVAWGVMFGAVVLQQITQVLQHNLLLYGGKPTVPLSDLAQAGSFWIGAWTYRVYWAAFAVLLLVAAHVFWRRGVDVRLAPRLARARFMLRGVPGRIALGALLVFGTTGAVAFRNTNVLAGYVTEEDEIARMVDYERQYAQYLDAPQPTMSHLTMDVALYPAERRAVVTGSIRLVNETRVPITELHVRVLDAELKSVETSVDSAAVVRDDTVHRHRIYRLARAMRPGEVREVRFSSVRHVRGYRNGMPETRLIENGSFLYESQLAPAVGLNRWGMLDDPDLREEHGLPPIAEMPSLDDTAAYGRLSGGLGWATSDITVSTSADQVPLSVGNKVSDVVDGDRRTARFVHAKPTRARFTVLSARYAEQHRTHRGVDIGVYYHAAHSWNVERMLEAAARSLDYYIDNFGPYQFDHFRIVELPGYYGFAQAFGGTIPFSEVVGFTADITKPETIDQVTGMTSHELAHQWWALQVAGAAVEGESVLSETMAQYASHMVVKHLRGEDQIRRYTKFELDRYLAARGDTDPPLIRARGEYHLLYRKGAMVMYLTQQRLGEAAVNRALRSLVERFATQTPPYATTRDLVAALRREATTEEQQALITDLFERVTLYDLSVEDPTAVQRADGRWDVSVPVVALKLYVDSTGVETAAPLDEGIEIGLFTEMPGRDAFDATHVLLMERRMIRSGRQVLTFVMDRKPLFAGVDPYNYYIDRGSGDNIRAVK